ncbi:hypothetical protein [Priestia megaterium]|nr:hypothetical protein [Priestia megaterium]MDC7781851.1 hypothetical protein [Priestia megaterium]
MKLYEEYFNKDYYKYKAGYKEWKKTRPAKHKQTKALRKTKKAINPQQQA